MHNNETRRQVFLQTFTLIDQYLSNIKQQPTMDKTIIIGSQLYGPQLRDGIRPPSQGQSSIDDQQEEMEVYFPTVKEVLQYTINPESIIVSKSNTMLIPYKFKSILVNHNLKQNSSWRECYYKMSKYMRIYNSDTHTQQAVHFLSQKFNLKVVCLQQHQYKINDVCLRNIQSDTSFQELFAKIQSICGVEIISWTGLLPLRQTYNTIVQTQSLNDALTICQQLDWKNIFNEFEIIKANLIPSRKY